MCFYLCMHCKCKLPHIPGHLFSGNALRPKQLQSKYCWKKAPLYSWVLQLGHHCWKPLLFRVGRFLCNNLTAAHFLESWGKLRNGLNPAFQSWNFCCNYWVHFQSGFILTWSPHDHSYCVTIFPSEEHFGQICISHKRVTTGHILVFQFSIRMVLRM